MSNYVLGWGTASYAWPDSTPPFLQSNEGTAQNAFNPDPQFGVDLELSSDRPALVVVGVAFAPADAGEIVNRSFEASTGESGLIRLSDWLIHESQEWPYGFLIEGIYTITAQAQEVPFANTLTLAVTPRYEYAALAWYSSEVIQPEPPKFWTGFRGTVELGGSHA